MDIPWNVPRSHGIVGWDGQEDTHASVRGTGGHPVECLMVPWNSGMGWTVGQTHVPTRGSGGHPVDVLWSHA